MIRTFVVLSEAKDLYVTRCNVRVLRSAQDDNTTSQQPIDNDHPV